MPYPSRLADLLAALEARGGVATRTELVAASTVGTLRAAVERGSIARVGRGVYAVRAVADAPAESGGSGRAWSRWHEGPDAAEVAALLARHARARACAGALSHRCAAAHHGWPTLVGPEILELAVPHSRGRIDRVGGRPVRVRRRSLTRAERAEHVTSPLRTVLDCATDLPWPQAIAVADSALRSGQVEQGELVAAGAAYRGRRAAQVRRVSAAADGRAANPFESALRAVLLDVPEVRLEPQVVIRHAGGQSRVDLGDRRRRIAVEADSYEFHGTAGAFARDRQRYAELTAADWLVLPFGFGSVMRRPGWVRDTVRAAALVRLRQGYA